MSLTVVDLGGFEVTPGADVVTGPPGTITTQQIQTVVDQVVDELDDGPDLTLLYANAKA